ncbi:1-deoxy-D-xylulose-5-phosphate synthase [Aquirufa nivalisilvae]|uniref:1-deoxy-D-xylulose-5-phosphate synthase n=1 Tax=Aquirufa nivalisilvae TaxID=2516557 RepID=UPI0022A9D9E4|nr:1-deoxy-D-xylulose-5-phosphate synthase [Aquirufa nivalisilvae]MCZ2479908.1 1-deoxy-D-xylulose-5-phosphate synthase [Aquirufa nivalisilvae]MCZ2481902.1 1-deoxy-D-xylulose-5-phosphate synthase [Aquirufa nivalisilvae]
MQFQAGPILSKIQSPADLRKLSPAELPAVCHELRQFIIDHVSVNGGHFGASLGVTELTVALHYVFNTPDDQLVWDVGHQAYGHKILTGRQDSFHTNRLLGGISGFPKRSESEYDAFGVGHSSTSISAALGMAVASRYKKEFHKQHIAVIGDGSMTAGMAFEAMNHAGDIPNNMLIILNDNCMAIDPNVGALKEYLTDITTSHTYNRVKDDVWNLLGKMSKFGKSAQEIVSKIENGLKATLLKQSNLFESLNLRYFGPIDGHDVQYLTTVLNDLKDIPGPKILHCITTKGKGYSLAEKDQTLWHAPGKFDKITGEIHKKTFDNPQPPKYQEVFGHTILELAEQNPKIMGITPAMPSGSSLNIMMRAMPDRAFDVGIAEQHAVTFSAGLATQGLTVFCNIYSSFMQRGYDQVVHDVCLQKLPVIFCLDRAGLAGADGPTHHGLYDLAYMRCLPNMIVAAPKNEQELRNIMYTASLDKFKEHQKAMTIRYPRGAGVMPVWRTSFEEIKIGQGQKVLDGEEIAVLSIGHIGNEAEIACQKAKSLGMNPALYDMRFVKPLDEKILHEVFSTYNQIITVEDACVQGGFGSAIAEFMLDHGYNKPILRLGVPDDIIEHGEPHELYQLCGIDSENILKKIADFYPNKIKSASQKVNQD